MKGLYFLFLKRLCEIESKKEIIPFATIFEKLCRSFSIKKKDCMEILFMLEDVGFIEIYAKRGIKIIKKNLPEEKEIQLRSNEIPITCINECENCKKDFEAKITIQGTCEDCHKKWAKEIDKRVKEEIANGNTNPEWLIRMRAMIESHKN